MSKQLEIQESPVETLIRENKINIMKIGKIVTDDDGETWEAEVRASLPDGQYADDIGIAIPQQVNGLTVPESHAKAKSQAFTKAKRRAVFSLLGLRYGEKEEPTAIEVE